MIVGSKNAYVGMKYVIIRSNHPYLHIIKEIDHLSNTCVIDYYDNDGTLFYSDIKMDLNFFNYSDINVLSLHPAIVAELYE